jgi:predicted nucleic acid-binding protein
MIVVADMSPLLHLGRIRRLDLLPAVLGRVTIPQTAWRELVQPGTRPGIVAVIEAANWIDVVDDPIVEDLGLDPGETAAILLALQMQADALLIDDRRGRSVAMIHGIAVIGTLGIVAGARRLGVIEQAAPIVTMLRSDGAWLSDALVEEFLSTVGERP